MATVSAADEITWSEWNSPPAQQQGGGRWFHDTKHLKGGRVKKKELADMTLTWFDHQKSGGLVFKHVFDIFFSCLSGV